MLPTLGLLSATIGLLLIIFLIYGEQKEQAGKAERNMLLVVSLATVAVAAFHIAFPGGH